MGDLIVGLKVFIEEIRSSVIEFRLGFVSIMGSLIFRNVIIR